LGKGGGAGKSFLPGEETSGNGSGGGGGGAGFSITTFNFEGGGGGGGGIFFSCEKIFVENKMARAKVDM
jgi:hypothetical protein